MKEEDLAVKIANEMNFKQNFPADIGNKIFKIISKNNNDEKFIKKSLDIRVKLINIYENYLQYLDDSKHKKERTDYSNTKTKRINIIEDNIKDLEKIWFNPYLIKFFTNTTKKNFSREDTSEVYFMLKDLYKIKNYIQGKKGTISVKKILSDIKFDIIDEEYIKTLFYTPKYDPQKEVYSFIKSPDLNIENKDIILSEIFDYFSKDNSYNRNLDKILKNYH
jgi:Fe-S cluster biosynthesis and repair protein YggX